MDNALPGSEHVAFFDQNFLMDQKKMKKKNLGKTPTNHLYQKLRKY